MGGRRRGGRSRREEGVAEARRASRTGIKPDLEEVLRCVESLYQDKLKPFGRILRKRVAERHAEGGDLPEVDVLHLRDVCEKAEALQTLPEEGGDWSATFRDRQQNFVDIYSDVDSFSVATWRAAAEYFRSLPEEEAHLPGGRYSCAQALMERNLDFLSSISLGEVCHLVQLAISKHKILGYCNGAVVPYSKSQSRVKEECAVSQLPCASKEEATAMELASLQKARECLKEILMQAAVDERPSMIPLSNVKRLFRSRYQTELSETALGHSKLSDLLQDERFADICEVQLQGQGYIVVQVLPEADEGLESLAVDCLTAVLDDGLLEGYEPQDELPSLPTPLTSPGLATPNTVSRWPVYNLWPQGWGKAPPLPLGGKLHNSESTDSTADSARSEPKTREPQSPASGNAEPETPMKVESLILQRMHCCVEDLEEDEPKARPFCPGEPLALEEALDRPPPGLRDVERVKNTFIHSAATPLVTPEPQEYRRSQSVPKEMGYAEVEDQVLREATVPSPAFLVPPTPSSPLFSRGYEALLLQPLDMPNRVIRLAELI